MKIAALASGSAGNCFYIEDDRSETAVLIDAGISTRQISLRLALLGLTAEKIKGIFITHEHADHIKGADVFARKYQVPIFATKKTIDSCLLCSDKSLIEPIKNTDVIKVGGNQVQAFSKIHKAADPISYTIFSNKKVSVITDAGHACHNIIEQIKAADFLCLETNHDPEMLKNGPYPAFLKKWIAGDNGHLSNVAAGHCVLEHASQKLTNIVLSHLSSTNNTPDLALATFRSIIARRSSFSPKVHVSTQHNPTKLFVI
ncbi:MAG: MBL fold metallo-hydrolase [Deltaproteobacteria bacterium]|nr:MBL fold metallo-hydrolase [Deltaproteobacteria bacterium]